MNELIKFLKSKGFGSAVLIGVSVGAIGLFYLKYLSIKQLKQQIQLNEHELKKVEEEVKQDEQGG